MQGLELKGAARDVMVSQAGLAGARLLARSQHHGLIAGMNGEHPSAEGAARLALRWTAAQLLSYHMPVEVVELLVAHVYTGCAPSLAGTLSFCSDVMGTSLPLCSPCRHIPRASCSEGYIFVHIAVPSFLEWLCVCMHVARPRLDGTLVCPAGTLPQARCH